MKRMSFGAFAVMVFVAAFALVGCTDNATTSADGATSNNPLSSVNLQIASLNSTGQVATCVVLDNTPYANVDTTIAELNGCLNDAKTTVNGNVAFGNLAPLLATVIPSKYSAYMSQIELLVQGRTLPTDKIGVNNVKRILAFLNGALQETATYDKSLRADVPAADGSVVPAIKGMKHASRNMPDIVIDIHPDFYRFGAPAPAPKEMKKDNKDCRGRCNR